MKCHHQPYGFLLDNLLPLSSRCHLSVSLRSCSCLLQAAFSNIFKLVTLLMLVGSISPFQYTVSHTGRDGQRRKPSKSVWPHATPARAVITPHAQPAIFKHLPLPVLDAFRSLWGCSVQKGRRDVPMGDLRLVLWRRVSCQLIAWILVSGKLQEPIRVTDLERF